MEKEKSKEKSAWPLVGNRQISSFLEKSIKNDQIANTYIFLGPRDLGKTGAAVFFAKALLCQKKKAGEFFPPCGVCASCRQFRGGEGGEALEARHGDFHLLERAKDKKNISVDEVREFIRLLSLSSFSDSYKIGLIKSADDLGEEAANALLKTLEEPRPKVVVILTASRLDDLPSTIISRSQVLRFQPVKSSDIHDWLLETRGSSRATAKNASRLALGRPALAAKFAQDKEFYSEHLDRAEIFLDFFRQNANSRLSMIESLTGRDEEEKAERAIKIIGIWQGLVRDLLLLKAGHGGIVQHEILSDKMKALSGGLENAALLELNRLLLKSEDYVRANVNPKLVLENIAVNIKI